MSKDTIRRAPRDKEHPYMNLLRKIPQDSDLGLEELGLLVYILSLPNNWELQLEHIRRTKNLGINKLPKMMKKFTALGYCEIFQIRDSKGRFSHNEYAFHEEKIAPQVADNQHTENQDVAHNDCEPINGNRGTETVARNPLNGDTGSQPINIHREDNTEIRTPPTPKGEATKVADVCFTSSAKELTEEIIEALKEAKPTCQIPEKKSKWYKSSQELIDRGIEKAEILKVLRWALSDNVKQGTWTGWASKIWAKTNKIEYLNEKFDSLHEQMHVKAGKKDRTFLRNSDDAKAVSEWDNEAWVE